METQAPPTGREALEAVLLDPEQRLRLLSHARNRFGIPAQDGEDLLQETALDLLRHRSLIRNPGGFVFAVFHARCRRFVRELTVEKGLFHPAEDLAEPAGREDASKRMDQALALRRAFREISGRCRRILSAYYVEGQNLKEAADEMARAYNSAWTIINRCLRKLRLCIS